MNSIALVMSKLLKVEGVQGIVISSVEGIPIDIQFKTETKAQNAPDNLSAAVTSLVYIAQNTISQLLNNKLRYAMSYGIERTLLATNGEKTVVSAFIETDEINRNGVDYYVKKLEGSVHDLDVLFARKVAQNLIITKIKKAIPEAKGLALMCKDGSPIYADTEMEPTIFTGMISAIFGSIEAIESRQDIQVIAAKNSAVIILRVDETRLLAISTPVNKPIETYIQQVKNALDMYKKELSIVN